MTNPFRYTARELDTETSLYYYRARYYDPDAGHFLSEDPIGFAGSTNFYEYASQSPTNYADPSGRQEGVVIGTTAGCALAGPPGCAVGAGVGETVDILQGIAASVFLLNELRDLLKDLKKPCPRDNCDQLLREIYRAMNEINDRILDLVNDPLNLYNLLYSVPSPSLPPDSGTYLGHIHQAEGWQRRLRSLLQEAMSQGCPIPRSAWRLASRPLPNQPRGR